MPGSFYFNDQWTGEDKLNFDDFRLALHDLILEAETPLTIGVFGPWGSGKTSLLRMLEQGIPSKYSVRPVWFTAWKYDNQEAIWRAFLLQVLNALYFYEDTERTIKLENLTDKQKDIHEELDRLISSIYQPVEWQEEPVFEFHRKEAGLALAKIPAALLLRLAGQGKLSEDWHIDPDFAKVLTLEGQKHTLEQLQFIEQFGMKFEAIVKKRFEEEHERLVVFVDDLDRCLPEKAVEVLEAIKLFLNVERTVFVLGMDRAIIRKGIELRYQTLAKGDNARRQELPIDGESYLQKLIQIPFNLPPMDTGGMQQFFEKLDVKQQFALDDVTLGVFCCGVLPNPRQAKRVLNVYNLLRTTAENRNKRLGKQGAEEQIFEPSPVLLAKLVLIQSQWTELYTDWRQDPGLIQSFEREMLRHQYSDDELRRGLRKEDLPEGQTEPEEKANIRSTASPTGSGPLEKHWKTLWDNRLLRRLLAYPTEEDRKGLAGELPKTHFSDIKTYSEMMGYLALSGTIQSVASGENPADFSQEGLLDLLLSGEQLKINEAIQRIKRESNSDFLMEDARYQVQRIIPQENRSARERVNAGNALAALGDTRFREDLYHLPNDDMLGFVEIPAGKFWMGNDDSYNVEKPRHECLLPYVYYLARYPVTVAQWRAYVEHAQPQGIDRNSLRGISNHPVVLVDWEVALVYCQWLTKILPQSKKTPAWIKALLKRDWQFTLPSEAEWEKAARGTDGRIYPYGNTFDANKGNTEETGIGSTSGVGCFAVGASPYGCEEMSGNVWEWTRSLWGNQGEKADYLYPYDADDGREDLAASGIRVLRGGSFDFSQVNARCAFRGWGRQYDRRHLIGFRVCLSPPDVLNL